MSADGISGYGGACVPSEDCEVSRSPARAPLCSVWAKDRYDVRRRGLPPVSIPMNALRAEPRAFAVTPLCPAGGNCKPETARIRTTIKPGYPRLVSVRGAITCEFKSFALSASFEYFDSHLSIPCEGSFGPEFGTTSYDGCHKMALQELRQNGRHSICGVFTANAWRNGKEIADAEACLPPQRNGSAI